MICCRVCVEESIDILKAYDGIKKNVARLNSGINAPFAVMELTEIIRLDVIY